MQDTTYRYFVLVVQESVVRSLGAVSPGVVECASEEEAQVVANRHYHEFREHPKGLVDSLAVSCLVVHDKGHSLYRLYETN